MFKNYTELLNNLNKSKFRSSFNLGQKEIDYYKNNGEEKIKSHTYDFVISRLSDSYPLNDGKQTPMRGHPTFIAQHATATCCRKCLYKWHKIDMGKSLSSDEIDYVVNVIMFWLTSKIKIIGGNYDSIKSHR